MNNTFDRLEMAVPEAEIILDEALSAGALRRSGAVATRLLTQSVDSHN